MINVYLYPVPAFTSSYDVKLIDPTVLARRRGRPPDRDEKVCPIHDPGLCRRVYQGDGLWYCIPIRPVAKSLLTNLRDEYGAIEGNKTYLAMRHNQQGPFAPGNKYDVTKAPPPRPARKPTVIRRGTSARASNAGRRLEGER